jgi:hypothetical protein
MLILSSYLFRTFQAHSMCISEHVISECSSRAVMCKSGSVEGLSVETVARDGNCEI